MPTLPSTFAPIILAFAPLFFNGVWRRAQVLFLGALLAPGKRTVTSALQVMGLSHEPHFQFYHRVLNRTVWSCRRAGLILLRLLMAAFVPTGPLVLGLDDTIERRWGPKIAARGIYRDPVRSSDSHFVKTSGLRWISLMLLAPIPWAGHIWALPFLTALAPSQRYWEDRQLRPKTLIDWARQLVLQVQRWVPTRTLVLVTDGGFAALDLLTRLAGRPRPVICITRLRLDARLFRPAPRRKKGAKGRPRLVGTRLPSLQQVLTNPRTVWQRLKFSTLVWRRPASSRNRFWNGSLVSRGPASLAHPLGLGARPQRQVCSASPAVHGSLSVSPPNPGMVPVTLASGSDLPGSPRSPRGGDPTAVVRFSDCPHYPGVAGPVFDRDTVGASSRASRHPPGTPDRVVCQTESHLL